MQLTRAADYAVRLMIHFASVPVGTRLTREALTAATGLPESFVGKILQALSRAKLVRSRRGIDGGFVLAADARHITLVDIIEAVDGPIALNVCLMTGQGCNQQVWCGAHEVWTQAQAAMLNVLRSRSLADITARTASHKRAVQIKHLVQSREAALQEVGDV
jgi:Rrf2 family protein